MNIFEEYLDLIKKLILKNQKNLKLKNLNEFKGVVVEIPPTNFDCDLSSNVCLILGKINKIDPKEEIPIENGYNLTIIYPNLTIKVNEIT